jgi:4-azaleucine resistance transporter AzlC
VKEFKQGVWASLPLVPGIVAFGLLYGVLARQVGFSPVEAWAMSLLVHAGSAQFVALGMWGMASAATIIATTLVINLRHLLMGASLAPHLRATNPAWKPILALWMSDETYALAVSAYERGEVSPRYFFGANVCTYMAWTTSGLLGALLGSALPNPGRYGLGLIFPLAFLGLLMTFLGDRINVTVAVAAGGLALVGALFLPGSWYILVAGLLGSALGLAIEESVSVWRRC